jgi:hypothetical protein
MAVIGIITCEIFELEFAKLLNEDSDVSRITVLEDDNSEQFIKLLNSLDYPNLQCLPHPHSYTPEPDINLEVLMQVLEIGQHRSRKILTSSIVRVVKSLQQRVDVLLLGYGMCGGVLTNISELLDVDIPVFQPMDGNHPVHDCVALSLGNGDKYYSEQRKKAGTYFLTPGWSQHWRKMLDMGVNKLSQPGIERLLSGYERALLVHTPAISRENLRKQGVEFEKATGLHLEAQDGTMAPLVSAWDLAKSAIYSGTALKVAGGSA